MGFAELLTVVFILLKVFGVISWSWWLVWLPEIIAGVIYLIMLIVWFVQIKKITKETKSIQDKSESLREEHKEMMKKFNSHNDRWL